MSKPTQFSDINSSSSGRNFIDLQWTSGASGAVPATLDRNGSGEIVSVVHGATGVYTITLANPWADFLVFTSWVRQASYSASGACFVRITADNTQSSPATFVVLAVTAAGAAVEPASGDVIYINIEMQSNAMSTAG